MKRLIDHYLQAWKMDPHRMPLLLRGARQVGKTFAARQLGKSFDEFIEVNLEEVEEVRSIFDKNLSPDRLIRDLSFILKRSIIPGRTLLFFDEIQAVPKALLALRYFYEKMPELHVIAAGSLLDFAIEEVGIPVGRVQSLYVYPLSFLEFLAALDETLIIEEILIHELKEEITTAVHNKILSRVAEYLALGGMPKVVDCFAKTNQPRKCALFHAALLDAYRQDFVKYAKKHQIKYLELLFDSAPHQIGEKFKYNVIEGDYRKRELAPALDLLTTAGIAHRVFYSAGQGIPIGAQADLEDYKVLFLDVGLTQAVLDLDLKAWFLNPFTELINKGSLVEAFVGQELRAYSNPNMKKNLYYWHAKSRTGQAEIDYLMQDEQSIIPIEVKAGSGRTLKSLHIFLSSHQRSPYGIRFSTLNYSLFENLHSYPLYAVAKVIAKDEMKIAIKSLI